jgi:hypothetical protein
MYYNLKADKTFKPLQEYKDAFITNEPVPTKHKMHVLSATIKFIRTTT